MNAPESQVHAYVPMSFAPGEAYQFDWSHETITLQGLPLTIKAAHMKLSHSRMPFVRVYFRETQELVLPQSKDLTICLSLVNLVIPAVARNLPRPFALARWK